MGRVTGALFFCGALLISNAVQSAEVQYTAKTLRDPFSDAAENNRVDDTTLMEQSLSTMNVQGILYTVDNPVAIIEGKIYRVGSSLGAGRVVQIEKEGVTVSLNGKQFTIKQRRGKTNANQQKKP